jgi:hypothetical protein
MHFHVGIFIYFDIDINILSKVEVFDKVFDKLPAVSDWSEFSWDNMEDWLCEYCVDWRAYDYEIEGRIAYIHRK